MSLLRAGALVAALTLAGRALGYARTAAAAALLGAGGAADAFFVALRLVGLLRAGFAAGGVQGAFVPPLARRLEADGPGAARRLAGDAFVSVLAALAAAAVVAAFAMPWLVRIAAPGLAANPGQLDLAVALARVMLPLLVLGGPALVLGAVLNGAGRFAAAASMAVLFNLAALAGLFALGPLLGSPAHGLAAGVAAAGAVQLAVLLPACRRAGLGLRPRLPRFGPEVRLLLRRAAPAAVAAGAMQAVLLADLGVATLLGPGAASHLDYAARVSGLGPALVGAAAATVLLPRLARGGGLDDAPDSGGTGGGQAVNRTLEAVLLLGVPGAAALAAGAEPFAAALFRHGAFTAADAAATAQAMTAYAAGLPAWVAAATLASVLFARGEPGPAMGAALAAVAVNLGLSLALMGPLGHAGIALATAAAAWLHAALLLGVLLHRRAFAPDRRLGVRLRAIVATGAATGLAVWLARAALGDGAGAAERFAILAALGAAGLLAFALAATASGALRPRELAAAWKRR